MKGFIVYSTYRIIRDKPYVFLFGRLENKENFVTINSFTPYFFIKEKDLTKAKKLSTEFEAKKVDYTNPEGQKVIKLELKIPAEVTKLRKRLEDHSIVCYEADIKFSQRFLIDKKIQGSLEIKGDYDQEEQIDRVYKEPELYPIEWMPELVTLSIDIETDSKHQEIYSISMYTKDFKKVLIRSDKKLKDAISYKNEEELLTAFVDKVQDLDPDIITGWNLIDFDLKIIFQKLNDYKILIKLGRDNTGCKLRIESSFFRESKADLPGRQVIDAMQILKSSFVKLTDYKLDTAARTLIKDHKLIGEQTENKPKLIEQYFKHQPQKLADYNLKDAELVMKILEKTNTLELTIKRSLIAGMPLDRVAASISSLDSIYLKRARERKLVLPSSKFVEKDSPIKGAFVKESIPGIYDFISVLDFKSLYSSIIMTFNIDPITFRKEKEKNCIEAPTKVYFTKDFEGILPGIIEELWKEREVFTKKKDQIGRFAIKTLINSFWGALASNASRYYNQDLGNAITGFARYLIQFTAEQIEKEGYKVIYSDTDSCFVQTNARNLEQAIEIGQKLEKEINNFYRTWIKKNYGRESKLHLEYEKTYIKFLMPKLRHDLKAAKKRYAGLLKHDEKEEINIVGLEFVRGDWTELAKTYQKEILNRIFHDKEIIQFTKKFVEDTLKGKYDKLLIYRKSIRKELEAYTKITPSHVKAARKLDNLSSSKIEYMMTTDGPEPIQKIKHKIDYEHYIEKQIKPIAESILALYNKTFEEVEKGHKQTSLTDF